MPLTRDSYGIKRGQCMACDKCAVYQLHPDSDVDDCATCGHKSLKHRFLSRPSMPQDYQYDESSSEDHEEDGEGDNGDNGSDSGADDDKDEGEESQPRRERVRVVYFGDENTPYSQFSNRHCVPIDIDGRVWRSVSHYYESCKYPEYPELIDQVLGFETPSECEAYSAGLSKYQRKDWAQVKEQLMISALRAKFGQHGDLRRSLIDTKTRTLIYTSDDRYWGNGGESNLGENYLGRMLMRVRGEIRSGIVRTAPFDKRRVCVPGDAKCCVS